MPRCWPRTQGGELSWLTTPTSGRTEKSLVTPLTAPSSPMLDVTTTQMVSSLWPAMPWPMSGMPTLRQRRPMRTALKRRPKRRPERRSERRNKWHPLVVTRTTVSRPAKPPGLIVWMLPMMMKVAVGPEQMRRRSPEQQLTVPHNPGHARSRAQAKVPQRRRHQRRFS